MHRRQATGEIAFTSDDLSMRYGDQTVLDIPSHLGIPRGFTAIVGLSGSGKSTLLNIAAGFVTPITGEIRHFDTEGTLFYENHSDVSLAKQIFRSIASKIVTQTPDDRRESAYRKQHTGYISQQPKLHPELSMIDYIRLSHAAKGYDIYRDGFFGELVDELDIRHLLNKKPTELSGGEEQRGAIVNALVHRPDFIFADEPTSALDPENSERTFRLFSRMAKNGSTVLAVSHDTSIKDFADNTIMTHAGKIVETSFS